MDEVCEIFALLEWVSYCYVSGDSLPWLPKNEWCQVWQMSWGSVGEQGAPSHWKIESRVSLGEEGWREDRWAEGAWRCSAAITPGP